MICEESYIAIDAYFVVPQTLGLFWFAVVCFMNEQYTYLTVNL